MPSQLDGVLLQRLAAQSTNNNTNTSVSWDTVIYNRGTMWAAGSPTRITIKTAGVYLVMAGIAWDTVHPLGDRYCQFFKNGAATSIAYDQMCHPQAGAINMMQARYAGLFAVNDYLEVVVQQGSTASLNVNGSTNTFVSAQMVSL